MGDQAEPGDDLPDETRPRHKAPPPRLTPGRCLPSPTRSGSPLLELLGRDGPMTVRRPAMRSGSRRPMRRSTCARSPSTASSRRRPVAPAGSAPGPARWPRRTTWELRERRSGPRSPAAEGYGRGSSTSAHRGAQGNGMAGEARASYPEGVAGKRVDVLQLDHVPHGGRAGGAVGEEIVAIIDRYSDRVPRPPSKRPEGALPVALVATGHPIEADTGWKLGSTRWGNPCAGTVRRRRCRPYPRRRA